MRPRSSKARWRSASAVFFMGCIIAAPARGSGCRAQLHGGEIHRHGEGDVHIVGEQVQRDMGQDLDDLAVAESADSPAWAALISAADAPALRPSIVWAARQYSQPLRSATATAICSAS